MKNVDSSIYFGIAGWSYNDWKGIVYPQGASSRFDELGYLANYFDVIELNNTFYRIPASKMVENWVKRVHHNSRFQFTVKIYQGFTHEKKPISTEELKQFLGSLESLTNSGRLGAFLAQFPAAFKYSPETVDHLSALIEAFHSFPVAVEFRHRSWIQETVLHWLESQQVSFCNVDEPVFRHHVKPSAVVTGPVGYVRLHGRNYESWYSGSRDKRYDYLYSEDELDRWIPGIEEMGKKAETVYVIGNNHFRGQAPANILQLKSKTIRGPVPVPDPMLDAFPQLKSIAAATKRKKTGQGELFGKS